MRHSMKMRSIVGMGVLLSSLVAGEASAVPVTTGSLGLTSGNPDIQHNFLNFDFDFAGESLNINGVGGGQFTFNSLSTNIANSTFSISGDANATDASLLLQISGDVGSGNQVLLAGDLSAMANSGFGVFEFIFGNLTGALSSLYGTEAGVIFTDGNLASFDFTQDAATLLSGMSDTIGTAVPVSGSLSLCLLSASLLGMSRRRKRDSSSKV